MILVTGSTGFIGKQLVQRLLDDGHDVRCYVHKSQEHKAQWDPMPELVVGTLSDEEKLFRAMHGVHVIIHLESAQWWGMLRELEQVEVTGTRNILEAARAARVGRLITMSHLGATPAAAYPLLKIKGQVEEIIRSSGLAYTIIRSGLIFGSDDKFYNHIAMMLDANPFYFLMPGRGEVVLHPLHIDDLIEALVCSLKLIHTVDKTIDIGGPEYITLSDLVRTMMRISGRYRTVISVPPYAIRWLTNAFGLFFARTLLTPQWLDILATNRTASIGTMFNTFALHPRRLEDTMMTYVPGNYGWFSAFIYRFRRRPRRT